MTVAETPIGPLWTTSRFIAALLLIGTVTSAGALPLLLLFLYLHVLAFRFLFRLLMFSARKSRDGVKQVAQHRRSERLKRSLGQARALVQISPKVASATDYGEVASLLANIPGLKADTLSQVEALNAAEQRMLQTTQAVLRGDPATGAFQSGLDTALEATNAFLTQLTKTPALPAPELASGWLTFHEETRMSVQEIQNTLEGLRQSAAHVTALQQQLQDQANATGEGQDDEAKEKPSFDVMLAGLDEDLQNLGADTKPKVFQDLFELSQKIDAAFVAADRQPPNKLGLVPEDVRRVHQMETLLSVYREKIQRLDQERAAGTVDESTYITMKSAWERMLEGELSALETAQE